ncbi:MAG: tetratricopeptide repeat protein [Pseudomonadota bacterium]
MIAVSALLCGCAEPSDPYQLFKEGRYDQAFVGFLPLAENGDAEAANYVGIHYYVGAGTARDFDIAAKWFEDAALQGHAGAQKNLGVMYYRGLGVKQNYQKAFGWMYHARKGGNKEAANYLFLMQDNVTPNASGVAVKAIATQIDKQVRLIGKPN